MRQVKLSSERLQPGPGRFLLQSGALQTRANTHQNRVVTDATGYPQRLGRRLVGEPCQSDEIDEGEDCLDGILLHQSAGALPKAQFQQLLDAVQDVDMDEVKAQVAAAEATS